MVEFQGVDEVNAINEVVKTVVFFHQTLDQKKEDLQDALDDIQAFYNNDSIERQTVYDLDGNPVEIDVLRPLSRKHQPELNSAINILSAQVSGVFVVANDMRKQLYQLGTERISANNQSAPAQPTGENPLERIKNTIMQPIIKKQKEYATLNELDDPSKISKNQQQQIENFTVLFDKFVELHTSYGLEVVEETTLAGQAGVLNLIVNIFNSRIKSRLLRLIDESERIQREAERNEAVKTLLQAKMEADRKRNAMLGMPQMPPQQ